MAGKIHEDFLSLGINSLKSYLNVWGAAASGYSKLELVVRVFSASEMNLPIVCQVHNKNSLWLKITITSFSSMD